MCQAAVFQDLKICVEKNVSLFGANAFGAEFSGYFSLSPHAKKKSGGFFVLSLSLTHTHTPPFPLKRGAGTKEKEEEVFLPIRMDSWTRLSSSLARFSPVLALNSPKNTRDTALPKHGIFLKNNIFQTFFSLWEWYF